MRVRLLVVDAVQEWRQGKAVVADGERATFVATRDVRVVEGAADALFGVRTGPGTARARVFGLYRQVQRCTARPTAPRAGTGRRRERSTPLGGAAKAAKAAAAKGAGGSSGSSTGGGARAGWSNYETPVAVAGRAGTAFAVGTRTVGVAPLVLDGTLVLPRQAASFLALNRTHDHPLIALSPADVAAFNASPAAQDAVPPFCFTNTSLFFSGLVLFQCVSRLWFYRWKQVAGSTARQSRHGLSALQSSVHQHDTTQCGENTRTFSTSASQVVCFLFPHSSSQIRFLRCVLI